MQKCILLVDDDDDVLETMQMILESEDHTVYTAVNVNQARAIMLENTIHLVIMDYVFGDCTGDQIIRDLKKVDEDFSVIFLSGLPQVIRVVEDLEFEVYRVFLKPIDPEILLSAIKSIFTEYIDPYQHLDTRQIINDLTPFH